MRIDCGIKRTGKAIQEIFDPDDIVWADTGLVDLLDLFTTTGDTLLEFTHIQDEHRGAVTGRTVSGEDTTVTDELDELNRIGAELMLAGGTHDFVTDTLEDLKWVVGAHIVVN